MLRLAPGLPRWIINQVLIAAVGEPLRSWAGDEGQPGVLSGDDGDGAAQGTCAKAQDGCQLVIRLTGPGLSDLPKERHECPLLLIREARQAVALPILLLPRSNSC